MACILIQKTREDLTNHLHFLELLHIRIAIISDVTQRKSIFKWFTDIYDRWSYSDFFLSAGFLILRKEEGKNEDIRN